MKNGKLMKIPQDSVEDLMSKVVVTKIRNDYKEDKSQISNHTKPVNSSHSTTVNQTSLRNNHETKVNSLPSAG